MNDDQWEDFKENLGTRFGSLAIDHQSESREDDVGHTIKSQIESIEFDSELGHLKIERVSRPKILDKKSHYHKSGVAKVEYVVSDTEMSHKINVYKKDEVGEWRPLDLPAERLSF